MDWTTRARFEDKNFGERVAGLDVFGLVEVLFGYVSILLLLLCLSWMVLMLLFLCI